MKRNALSILLAAAMMGTMMSGSQVFASEGGDSITVLVESGSPAEALANATAEAFEEYGDKISEIDVSKLSIEETVNVISYVIEEKLNFPAGEIDFMDWLISNL